MENFTNEDILERYPLCLRKNIQELWMSGHIGVSHMYIQINLPPQKLDFDYDIDKGNTFTLNIPYAGKNLQWEVLFNDEDPLLAPDFDILNDTFLTDPSIDVISKNIPTLTNWNVNNSKSLVNVIKEFLVLYKKYQLEKLRSDTKFFTIQEEYQRIKKELKLTDDDIEIYVENNMLNILISLKLKFPSFPIYIQQSYFGNNGVTLNPGLDSALLRISFLPNRVNSYLQLSPRLEQVFGDYTTLQFPGYKKNDDMVEYIQLIYQLVEDKVNQINEHFRLKEEYFSILLSLHGMRVLEYDNVTFSHGWFLFEVDDFYFMVQITIGNKFPQEKPMLVVKSIYHKKLNGEPYSLKVNNCPYNAQMKPEEMVNKMLKHLQELAPKLRNHFSNSAK